MMRIPTLCANCTVAKSNPGLTRNCAPASTQRCAASASSTVPAPTSTSPPMVFASCAITSTAPGTVMVNSTTGMPPAQTASAACIACLPDDARTTGTMPISRIFFRTCSFSVVMVACLSGRCARRRLSSPASLLSASPWSYLRAWSWQARRGPPRSQPPTALPARKEIRR